MNDPRPKMRKDCPYKKGGEATRRGSADHRKPTSNPRSARSFENGKSSRATQDRRQLQILT